MSELYYTLNDANHWASFSNDNNPIHFNLSAAKKIGLTGLAVHGMRALLDIKQLLTEKKCSDVQVDKVMHFTTRMQLPLLCNTYYYHSISEKSFELTSKLVDKETGKCCTKSRLTSCSGFQQILPVAHNKLSYEHLVQLKDCYPANVDKYPWIYISSILFRTLLTTHQDFSGLENNLIKQIGNTLSGLFSITNVVQTHHEVFFISTLLHSSSGIAEINEDLDITFGSPLIMGNSQAGYVIQTRIECKHRHKILMQMNTTLKVNVK